jgi:clan AA aspartic protease
MRGNVTPDGREAVMPVSVLPDSGTEERRVDVVVDTGFTGYLTLRPGTVEALSLPTVGSAESVLADGSVVLEDVCIARALWHGEERSIRVLVADATPILGMSLLGDSELRVRVEEDGEVLIERLSG